MGVAEISDLLPETRAVIERYLEQLEAGLCGVTRHLAQDVIAETESHLLDVLDPDSDEDVALRAVADLGAPDAYAAALCAEMRRDGALTRVPSMDVHDPVAPSESLAQPAGHFLGMPVDLKLPTAENLRSRMWNPLDPRIFTPRLIGLGWSINFAAIAVRLGIINPDDEETPFAGVPTSWLLVVLALPVAATVFALVVVAAGYSDLPEILPTHWGVDSQPDGFSSRATAVLPMLFVMVAASLWSLWVFTTGRSQAARALAVALASMFVVIAGAILLQVFAYANGRESVWWWPWAMIGAAFGIPFIELVVLAMKGRAGEISGARESGRMRSKKPAHTKERSHRTGQVDAAERYDTE